MRKFVQAMGGSEEEQVKGGLINDRWHADNWLKGATQGLQEMTSGLQSGANTKNSLIQSLSTARLVVKVSEGVEKLESAAKKLDDIDSLLNKLNSANTTIDRQQKEVQAQHTIVYNIHIAANKHAVNKLSVEDAIKKGKDASEMAKGLYKLSIEKILVDVRDTLQKIESAKNEVLGLIEEAKNLQLKQTPVNQETPSPQEQQPKQVIDYVEINKLLVKTIQQKNQEIELLRQTVLEKDAEIKRLQQQLDKTNITVPTMVQGFENYKKDQNNSSNQSSSQQGEQLDKNKEKLTTKQ